MAQFRPNPLLLGAALAAVLVAGGCTRDGQFQAISMWNESRLKPLEESPFPEGASSSLTPPPGTVARGQFTEDNPIATGKQGKALLTKIPYPVTDELLKRGQERFNVYCAPCHSRLGDGKGQIPRRGFPNPPDYRLDRLQKAPVGHFFDVMTNGYGVMYSYASRVTVPDRWAIAAYIRVLQKVDRPVIADEFELARKQAKQTGIPPRPRQRP